MKIAILLIIILIIIFSFRFMNSINKKNQAQKDKENVIDLEKDPNSDEYKPKD